MVIIILVFEGKVGRTCRAFCATHGFPTENVM